MRTINKIIKSQKQEIMPGRYINAPLPAEEDGINTSPFILLHHFGPFEVNYLNKFQFEPHPHKGFEAVTIVLDGEFEHSDSTGGHGNLAKGDVQWMTAGSGILHEEKQPESFLEKGGMLQGVQLWINLPKAYKLTKPKYQDIRSGDIPLAGTGIIKERVIAGNYKGVRGPASTFTPMTVVHAVIPKSETLTINVPKDSNTCVYFLKGSAKIGDETAGLSDMAIMNNDGSEFSLTANEDTEILLLSGEPINEPVVQYGPFVMNTMGEIKEAFLEYREGKYGNIN
jgi:redox-sensitive bicupin YhaK (pirin superfamily)